MNIAFVGLGNMGAPMAGNLAKAGYKVLGYDLHAAIPAGVQEAGSASDAAFAADILITMLPDGGALKAVAEDVLEVMAKGTILLDCSTIDVATAREVAEQAAARGILALDAPVSGGTGGAEAGTLTFMVGGPAEAFAEAQPLFEVMGSKAVHCGPAGSGQAAKICNNMILGATMIATCEAFALAEKLGLEAQAMFDVVSTSSGASWSMNTYCPAPGVGPETPADRDYKPGFSSDLMLKDLRLAQAAAREADADTPLGALAADLYATFVEDENGRGRDFSAMLPRLLKRGHPG